MSRGFLPGVVRGVSLLELLVVLVLVGLAVGLGAAVLSPGVRSTRMGLDGAEEALRRLRVGDCVRFEGGSLLLLRGSAVYGRVRLPGVRVVPPGFRGACRTGGTLVGADDGRPLGYRVCWVPEAARPASGPAVCWSPVGAVVFRTPLGIRGVR